MFVYLIFNPLTPTDNRVKTSTTIYYLSSVSLGEEKASTQFMKIIITKQWMETEHETR